VAYRDGQDLSGPPHCLAFCDVGEVTEDDDTDLADLQVLRNALGAVLELQQLVRHRRGKATDAGDAVTGVGDGSDLLACGGVRLVRLDEALQRVPDLLRSDRQLRHLTYVLALVGAAGAAPCVLRSCVVASAGQASPNFGDTPRDGAVDDLVAHADGESTHDLRRDLDVQVDVPPVDSGERGLQSRLLCFAQRNRGPYHGDVVPGPLGHQLTEMLETLFQGTSSRPGDSLGDQGQRRCADLARAQVLHQGALVLDRGAVRGQRGAEFGLTRDDPAKPEQLVLDALEFAGAGVLSDRRQYSGLFDRVDQVARPGPLRPDDIADHEEGCRGHLRLEKAVDQLGLAVRGAGGV